MGKTDDQAGNPRPTLEPGGLIDSLPRGSLGIADARELLAIRSIPGAYEPGGTVAQDTLRVLGEGAYPPIPVPRDPPEDVVAVCKEEVVWAGQAVSHYGHFLTESTARLWSVLPGARLADLPVVFTAAAGAPVALDWLNAFGARTVELPARGAVRFTRMFVPEPAWRHNAWIAPEVRDIHLQARRGLEVQPAPERDLVWLSRSRLARSRVPYDEALLEWLLREQMTIVTPETMTLGRQIGVLESARAVAGVVGSAFHTLLMAERLPECLYLCPPWDRGAFPAQHRYLDTSATFSRALAVAARRRRARETGLIFPGGYRLLVPDALRALRATVLPGLFEDQRLAAFAAIGPHRPQCEDWSPENEIDAAVATVLCEPLSVSARMRLGALFEAARLTRCAIDQFAMAADLTDDDARAPLQAARLLHRGGETTEASTLARQALAINPELREATRYVIE